MRKRVLADIVRKVMTSASMDKTDVVNKSYEEAVKVLNSLQSNAQALELIRKQRDSKRHQNIPNMIKYLERTGIKMADLDNLSTIHVSGTKGKGSTCAFCESILRHNGYKTGFFSSPHLVEVRERIRINGKPLAREAFSSYFWEVYNRLNATKADYDDAMPGYFAFLTVMGFHVFLAEKVDVAIVEVGIGGQYDSTNVIQNPVVCGVTSLGHDHTSILGNTLDKIAWHKAGIFKEGCPAVTAPQAQEAVDTLLERSRELGSSLYVTAPLEHYYNNERIISSLGIAGHKQRENAALALQLCRIWMETHNKDPSERKFVYHQSTIATSGEIPCLTPFSLSEQTKLGLQKCCWFGRDQMICHPAITYYLDGAHTKESIEQCVQWFLASSKSEAHHLKGTVRKVLVFNSTGDRDVSCLLSLLKSCQFDAAVFCPNLMSVTTSNKADQINKTVTRDTQLSKALSNKATWEQLNLHCSLSLESSESGDNLIKDGNSNITTGNTSHRKQLIDSDGQLMVNSQDQTLVKLDGKAVVIEEDLRLQSKTLDSNGYLDASLSPQPAKQQRLDSEVKDGAASFANLPDQTKIPLSVTFPCIHHALFWVTQGRDTSVDRPADFDGQHTPDWLTKADHIQVLVTGSLHLVGGVLGLISPEVTE